MIHKPKGLYTGIYLLNFIIIPWYSTYCAEIAEEVTVIQVNVTKADLGDFCLNYTCQVNQYCDRNNTCSCLPGFKVYNNECVLYSGPNGKCERHEDCEERLLCINGICRKPKFSNEFAILVKICLGITVTTFIIAIFSSLIKCIIRYDNSQAFRRHSDLSSVHAHPALNRNEHHRPGSTPFDVREEKPPSYEECIRSSAPPPYIISNYPATLERSIIQPTNLINVNPQNETPLNIQNLNQKINSK